MKFRLPKHQRVSPNYARKISEVLLEFAEEIAPRDSAPHVFAHAVDLAIILWNLALLPEDQQKDAMVEIRQRLQTARQRPVIDIELQKLLELRKTRYGSDRRLVADYRFVFEAKGPRLTVSSLDTNRPENRRK